MWEDEGWIEIDKVFFGERVIKKLKEFKKWVKWKEMVWKRGGWKEKDERKERVLYRINRKVKGIGGFLVGLGDKEREALRRSERGRMR